MRYSFRSLVGKCPDRPIAAGPRRPGATRRRSPEYEIVVVGAGGHGLRHRPTTSRRTMGSQMSRVLEKGWLGGGNMGRNTTIIRSNYLWDDSAHLYDHSLKLWESLSQELNYNLMFLASAASSGWPRPAMSWGEMAAPGRRTPPQRHRFPR